MKSVGSRTNMSEHPRAESVANSPKMELAPPGSADGDAAPEFGFGPVPAPLGGDGSGRVDISTADRNNSSPFNFRSQGNTDKRKKSNPLKYNSSRTIATVTTQDAVTVISRSGEQRANRNLFRVRKSPGCGEKFLAGMKLLAALVLISLAVAFQGLCWFGGSTSGQNICTLNQLTIEYKQGIPFVGIAVAIFIASLLIMFGFQNSDRGWMRGKSALHDKPEAKIRHFCFNFFWVEIAGFLVHLSFYIGAFASMIKIIQALYGICLVIAFIILLWKASGKKFAKYASYKEKKVLVAASCSLLAIEDAMLVFIQFFLVNAVLDFASLQAVDLDNLGSEAEVVESDYLFAIMFAASVVILLVRLMYILGFVCCVNPYMSANMTITEVEDPESGETFRIMQIIPEDVREQLRVRIEKEGCCSLTFYALIPGLTTFVTIGLFIAAVAISLSQPPLPEPSVFDQESFKVIIWVISGSLLVLSVLVYWGCSTWQKGFCVPEDTHHVIPKKQRFLFSMRGLEIADFVTDIGSVILIFKSFNKIIFWQITMVVSLFLTLVVNVAYYLLVRQQDKSKTYQGKKKRIALSIALLAVEDVIMLPINVIYLIEVNGQGSDPENQFSNVEVGAVVLSAATGAALFAVRLLTIFHHLCCGRAIYVGGLIADDGTKIL